MNAAKLMEDFCSNAKEVTFRRRLSGVVFKPPYAADTGNIFVVSDKGKTATTIAEGIYQRAERK